MLKNYFITAFRNLRRNKIYSFINVMGLSLGLACVMLIILYVKDEVSYDRFHKNVNQVFRIVTQNVDLKGNKGDKNTQTGYFQGPTFTAGVPEIQSFVRIQSGSEDIKRGNDIVSQDLMYVDSNFFSVFTFPLINGNPETCLKNPYSIVITEEVAKKQFGTADAFGKLIMLKNDNEFKPYTVTGIAKKSPQNSSIKFDVLLPLKVSAENLQRTENWFNFFLNTFVVLSPKAKVPDVESKMQRVFTTESKEAVAIITQKYGQVESENSYLLQSFTDVHLDKELPAINGLSDASNPVYSYILSGIALFILMIACINFVNLTIARSIKRAKEIGIRKVIGGARQQLIIQFLGESFLLCFIAFALAILIVALVLPVFNTLANKALVISYLFDMKLVAGYLALFVVTGMLSGFYPAMILSGYNPVQTLYSRFMLAGKNYLQKSLVIFQFALASFLIIATFTIYSQFNYLTSEKLGYDDSNLVMVNKHHLKRNEVGLLKDYLLSEPGILAVAPKNNGSWGTAAKVNGDSVIPFAYETVDENYIPMMKIPVLQGRNFSKDFPSDSSHSVIVNESFVQKAGWKNAIGQQVNFWYNDNEKYTVVGVVKDYHFSSLNEKIRPQLFTMKQSNNYGMVYIKINPASITASLKKIERAFKTLFPLNPYSYIFKDQQNIKSYEAEAKWKEIMLFSAILTIFISCIGLFGLSVLSAEKRIKEIGIRKVLGASVRNVVSILTADFLKLIIIALLISLPIAWVAGDKWLENYPYRVTLNWWMFTLAGLLVVFIALTTISFQAIRAAITKPVNSLRAE